MPRYNRVRDNDYSRRGYDDYEYEDRRHRNIDRDRHRNRQKSSMNRTRYDRYNDYDAYGRRYDYDQDDGYRPTADTGYDNDYFNDTLTGKVINKVNKNTESVKEKRKNRLKKEIVTVKNTSVQYENAELQKEYVNIRTGREVQLG